jgi:hypothetical protein
VEKIPVDSILAIGDSNIRLQYRYCVDTTDTTETVSAKAVLGEGIMCMLPLKASNNKYEIYV